jgi:hypothetical protein
MIRGTFVAAIAIASLACAGTWNVASAASSDGSAASSVQTGAQQSAATHTKAKRKTRRSKIERPQTNWLNPQPEPPSPVTQKPIQGGNWLNPQPEPPRPVTTKKLH